tara:strand:- start:286 stop:663 length:378 start_codon:yes stop_codon:yes gene_type:complete
MLLNFGWTSGAKLLYKRDRSNVSDLVELNADFVSNTDVILLNQLLQRMKEIVQPDGRFFVIPIPSLNSYEPKEFFDPNTLDYLIDIKFDDGENWHVPNGHRHINAAAHKHIATNVYSALGCRNIE